MYMLVYVEVYVYVCTGIDLPLAKAEQNQHQKLPPATENRALCQATLETG